MTSSLTTVNHIIQNLGKENSWSKNKTVDLETLYYNFLCAAEKHTSIPTNDIDEILHRHIELGEQYKLDCIKITGKVIDHKPSDSKDVIARNNTFFKTKNTMMKRKPDQELIINIYFDVKNKAKCDAFVNKDEGNK